MIQYTLFPDLLYGNSNQNSVVQVREQIHRSMCDQHRESRKEPTQVWSTNMQEQFKGGGQIFQQTVLDQLTSIDETPTSYLL